MSPRARSSHECHIPDRVITVHQTRSTPSPSRTAHTHTYRCETHTSRSEQTLCSSFSLTLVLSFICGQNNKPSLSHPKPQFGLSMTERQKEFPDTSQTSKQLPGWANVANLTFIGAKSMPVAAECRRAFTSQELSVCVPAPENRTPDALPHTAPAPEATENTCSCQTSSALSSEIRVTTRLCGCQHHLKLFIFNQNYCPKPTNLYEDCTFISLKWLRFGQVI